MNSEKKLYKQESELNSFLQESSPSYENVGFHDFFSSPILVVQTIRNGIPFKLFETFKSLIPFTELDWASLLNISTKTLQRNSKEPNFRFKPIHTEKILEIVEVSTEGIAVFGNKESFYNWLNTPSFALGNKKPSYLLQDSYGKEMVMAELHKIKHGILA